MIDWAVWVTGKIWCARVYVDGRCVWLKIGFKTSKAAHKAAAEKHAELTVCPSA